MCKNPRIAFTINNSVDIWNIKSELLDYKDLKDDFFLLQSTLIFAI
jgi:hypothetical protein